MDAIAAAVSVSGAMITRSEPPTWGYAARMPDPFHTGTRMGMSGIYCAAALNPAGGRRRNGGRAPARETAPAALCRADKAHTKIPDEDPRTRRARCLWLAIAIPFMLAAMGAAALGYGLLVSLGPDDPISVLQLALFMLFQIPAIVLGLAVGGWAWAIAGKLLFGLRRSDFEEVLGTGPQIAAATRYNTWCLDLLFGPRREGDSE